MSAVTASPPLCSLAVGEHQVGQGVYRRWFDDISPGSTEGRRCFYNFGLEIFSPTGEDFDRLASYSLPSVSYNIYDIDNNDDKLQAT